MLIKLDLNFHRVIKTLDNVDMNNLQARVQYNMNPAKTSLPYHHHILLFSSPASFSTARKNPQCQDINQRWFELLKYEDSRDKNEFEIILLG